MLLLTSFSSLYLRQDVKIPFLLLSRFFLFHWESFVKTRGRLKTLSLYKEMFYKTLQEELTWNIKSKTCDIKMTKCCKISYNPIQSAINIGSEVAIKEEFFVFSPFSEICGSCGCLRCGAVAGFLFLFLFLLVRSGENWAQPSFFILMSRWGQEPDLRRDQNTHSVCIKTNVILISI